ncbi:uncharacterized protein LOC142312811 [Anomaloglossus baeobatrachus]|uniref:uncharacterized protein LOC142312811 n=1 Tax=Anomaloglossus baeobatrachus TaxID=238106 RepID=UPI003F504936
MASKEGKAAKKTQDPGTSRKAHPEASPAQGAPTSNASKPEGARTLPKQAPTLEPWMRQTVALKLKAVDGRVPDMSSDVFCTKMILDQGFSRAETLSVQAFLSGIFLVTFATVNACRRYWEAMNAAIPDSPFHSFIGSCPLQRGEKRITVSMRNPHTPGRDISTFLGRFCTVVREPSHILNGSGFWTGKWSVTVRLHRELASEDGLQHLPPTFSLGNSFGLIYYPDMPHNCRKCGGKGHSMKTCQEDACRVCRVTGHSSKDCPKKMTCNLCGLAAHLYKDCPQREKSWARVAAATQARVVAASSTKAATTKATEAKAKAAKIPVTAAPAKAPAATESRKKKGTSQRKRQLEDSPVAEHCKLFIVDPNPTQEEEDDLLPEPDVLEQMEHQRQVQTSDDFCFP